MVVGMDRLRLAFIIYVSFILGFYSHAVYVHPGAPTTYVEPGSMESVASYIVSFTGGLYMVRHGSTGRIVFTSTDAGEAIQYAIDSCNGDGGGAVYLKRVPGGYNVSRTIQLGSRPASLYGSGVVVRAAAPLQAVLNVSGASGVLIADLVIDGAGLASVGLRMSRVSSSRLEKVVVEHTAAAGFTILSARNVTLDDCWSVGNGGAGFNVTGSEYVMIHNCMARSNGGYGFLLAGCNMSSIVDVVSSGNLVGIVVNASWNCFVGGVDVVYNLREGIIVEDCRRGYTLIESRLVHDNSASSPGGYDGISIRNSTYVRVSQVAVTGGHRYGVYEDPGCDNNTVTNCDLRNNTSGAVQLNGPHTSVRLAAGYTPLGVIVQAKDPSSYDPRLHRQNLYHVPIMVTVVANFTKNGEWLKIQVSADNVTWVDAQSIVSKKSLTLPVSAVVSEGWWWRVVNSSDTVIYYTTVTGLG